MNLHFLTVLRGALRGIAVLTLLAGAAQADDSWYPSKYGTDDTIGALNELSPEKTLQASGLVKLGKTYALGVETGPDSPAYSPRNYNVTVLQLDDGMGTPLGSNKATGNDDLMTFWMGIGSQIVTPSGLTKLSFDKLPPVATRGVLLDMAKLMGKDILSEGTAFNQNEIQAAAKAANITIEAGDVVLFHTGWLNVMESDPKRFMAGEPGLGVDGAKYLASLGVAAVGSDSWALEVLPGENPTEHFGKHGHSRARRRWRNRISVRAGRAALCGCGPSRH